MPENFSWPRSFSSHPDKGVAMARNANSLPPEIAGKLAEVEWQQPKTRLKKIRRDFFPSGQSVGN